MESFARAGRLAVLVLALTVFACASFAQEMPFSGNESASEHSLRFEHQHDLAPESQPGLYIQEQRGIVRIPLRQWSDSSMGLFFRGQRTEVGERLRFTDLGIDMPERFGTAEIGLTWGQTDSEGHRMGVSATYGTAGQRLLDSGLSPIVSATFSMERKKEDGDSWHYYLFYANNRAVLSNIPIPGVAYSFNGATSKFMIGVPFLFGMWRSDPLSVTVFASPFAITGDSTYRFWGPLLLYGSAAWRPKAYENLVAGSKDRLIYEKKEVGGGLRVGLGRGTNASLGYVRNIDRRFVIGRSITRTTSDPIYVPDADSFQMRISLAF